MSQGRTYRRCKACGKTVPKSGCQTHPKSTVHWAYEATVSPPGAPRRRTSKSGFATQREAQAALAEIVATVAVEGTYEAPSTMTLGEWIGQWLDSRRHEIKASTLRTYTETLRLHVLETELAHVQLRRLTAPMVRAHLNGIADSGRSRTTVANIHRLVSMVLEEAVRQSLIPRNPAKGQWRKPSRRTKDIDVPEIDALRRFFDTVADDEVGHLIRFAAGSGLRRREILGLKIGDIDFDAATVRVVRTLDDIVDGQPVWETTKSVRADRTVVIDPGTLAALKAQIARNREARLRLGVRDDFDGMVWLKTNGMPMTPDWVSRRVSALMQRHGLPGSLHTLRHGYVTHSLAAGVPLQVVSAQVGHHDAGFTASQYSHVLASGARDQAARLGALLDGTGS